MVGLQRPQPVVLTDEDGDTLSESNPAVSRLQNANGPSYSVFGTAYAGYATPTDMMVLKGSASKIVRVQAFQMWLTQTTGAVQTVNFIKRSAANSGGTSSQPTINKTDSADPAATAVLDLYSVIPASLGAGVTLVNQIAAVSATGQTPANFNIGVFLAASAVSFGRPITLRGVAESLAFNWGGAVLPAGWAANYFAMWTESAN